MRSLGLVVRKQSMSFSPFLLNREANVSKLATELDWFMSDKTWTFL